MDISKICWIGIITGLMILIIIPGAWAQQNPYKPLVNNTGIYLLVDQTWTFYQGYSFTLKSVSNEGDRALVQLKCEDNAVKSAILSPGEVFYYNITTNDSDETTIFSMMVSGIYSGEDTDIITFNPVYQYYDPTLPEPTPIQTHHIGDGNNTSNTSTSIPTGDTRMPGFQALRTAIIICLCGILLLLRKI